MTMDPKDDIRDPQPPTTEEEITQEERDAAYAAEYAEADDKRDADIYKYWDEDA